MTGSQTETLDVSDPAGDDLPWLLERAQALDPDAFDRLVDLYGRRVHAFLLRMTGRREDAEDLLQEVFLRLVRMLPSYSHQGNFEGWLFRIAANLGRDRIRRIRRSPIVASLSSGSENPPASDGERGWDGADEAAEPPDSGLLRNEQIDRMQRALTQLPDAEREVVLLRYYSSMSFAEIAEAMDTPLGTALARSHRGLTKLRRLMEEDA
jgi:RNA polymerase sigma-70 factor (ECF subfamily)